VFVTIFVIRSSAEVSEAAHKRSKQMQTGQGLIAIFFLFSKEQREDNKGKKRKQ